MLRNLFVSAFALVLLLVVVSDVSAFGGRRRCNSCCYTPCYSSCSTGYQPTYYSSCSTCYQPVYTSCSSCYQPVYYSRGCCGRRRCR